MSALRNRIGSIALVLLVGLLSLTSGRRMEAASAAATAAAEVSLLLDRAEKLEGAAAACRQKVASGEMSSCQVEVTFQNNRLISPGSADGLAAQLRRQAKSVYSQIEHQLELDKAALERQKRSIEMGLRELDRWTEANKEAQNNALKIGITAILGQAASEMEAQSKSAASFKGWLTRYDKMLREQGVPLQALQPKMEKALSGYINATIMSKSGSALKQGLSGLDLWHATKSEIALIAQTQAKSDAAIKELIQDPDLKRVLAMDNAGSEFAESLLKLAAHSKELEKIIGPTVDFGTFVVDYGYEATKWTVSRNRIIDQWHLSDQELKAVDSLKREITNTMASLNTSRHRLGMRQ
jgi:hypothetical protein